MRASAAVALLSVFATVFLGYSSAQQFQVSPASPNNLDPCKYFENVTDIQQLNHHEFVAFEQCLYYFLANRAQHQSMKFNAVHPIATLPPIYGGGNDQKSIKVRAGQITLQHFQLNEFLKDLNIVGYLELQWDDSRLSWEKTQWKVDKLQIHSANHIWIPVLSSQAYETSLRNDDVMEVRRLETSNRGNVSAIVSFSLKAFCDDSDFRHFPDDLYKCCFTLEPHFHQDLITLETDGLPVFTDPKYFRDYGWSMSGTIPTINPDPNLNFCINLQRSSSAVKIELSVPTWATAILFLFSPFLGSIRTQLYVKLFLLLLQILTLQLFSNRIAPHLGSAAATPVLMAIHELAIVLNTISIVVSLVIWMLSRFRRTLPPWNWLIRASTVVNKFVCVFNTPAEWSGNVDVNALEMEKGNPVNGIPPPPSLPGSSRYQADWNAAFAAIHGIAVTFLCIVFILGYLLIR